jgi:hypothetical protein
MKNMRLPIDFQIVILLFYPWILKPIATQSHMMPGLQLKAEGPLS